MGEVNSVLHVGLGKCGSSALQRALSQRPEFVSSAGQRYAYVAVNRRGKLVSSDALINQAARSSYGYLASANAEHLAGLNKLKMVALSHGFDGILARGVRPILSNEGWTRQIELFKEGEILERLGLRPMVVIYVRPQVAWLNSAWWQWGAWSELDFEAWLRRQLPKVDWWSLITPWHQWVGRSNVQVRLLPDDILGDFFAIIESRAPKAERSNASLPGSVLRLLQRHRELRPSAHVSALEFVLERHLEPNQSDATPWVLNTEWMERIINRCRSGNESLLASLDPDSQKRMLEDARWWDATDFAQKCWQQPGTQPASADDVDSLAASALAAVQKLDGELRALRDENRRLRDEGIMARLWNDTSDSLRRFFGLNRS